MKIMYICDNIVGKGGIERVILTKANYFSDELGYEVTIIVTSNCKKASFYNISKKIEVIDLSLSLNNIFNIFKYKFKINKIIKKLSPDIIFIPTAKEAFIYAFLSKVRKYSIREIHFSKKSREIQSRGKNIYKRILSNFYNFLEEKIMQKYDKLIVLTEEDKKEWNHNEIEVIYNPVTVTSLFSAELVNKKAIAIGRLDYQKGFDRLIKAWKLVVEEQKEWVLEIYGDGPLKEELLKQIEELGLKENVILKGVVKNIELKMLESSLYILSSRHEGLPLVLLEAMECGLPIISFDCPCGPRDVIKNGYNGYLIKDGEIEIMAEYIKDLLLEFKLRKEMGKNSKLESQNYSLVKIMNKWQDLISKKGY